MSNGKVHHNTLNRTIKVEAEFGEEKDVQAVLEGIQSQVIKRLVDQWVEAHGKDVLASIDLESVRKQVGDEVAVSALKTLVGGKL